MAWIPGDQPTQTGDCYLLQENGFRLLQENGCRILLSTNGPANWIEGDDFRGNNITSPGGCDDGNSEPVAGAWARGDNNAIQSWNTGD